MVDFVGLQSYLMLVGSFLGFISFFILINRWLKEKPILKFRLGRIGYGYNEATKRLHFNVQIFIDNTGERGTTLYDFKPINFSNKDLFEMFTDPLLGYNVEIPPHTSRHINWYQQIDGFDLVDKEFNGDFQITWTHSSEIIPVKILPDNTRKKVEIF